MYFLLHYLDYSSGVWSSDSEEHNDVEHTVPYSSTSRTTDSITDSQQPLPTLSRSSTASMLECLSVKGFVKIRSVHICNFAGIRKFKVEEVETATENFREDFLIGKGGFGKVYKGNFRHILIAVKVLSKVSDQAHFKSKLLFYVVLIENGYRVELRCLGNNRWKLNYLLSLGK